MDAIPCPGSESSAPYRSWVEISLAQIASNYRAAKAAVGEAVEVMPVVKADAYRHGAVAVSRTLCQQGARWLAVSNVDEGAALRDAGIDCRILVMADFLPVEREALLQYKLTPVIHCLHDIAAWNDLLTAKATSAPYHLKIDSGMGRLGTRSTAPEIARAIQSTPQARLEGLMTHFASSANYTASQTSDQIQYFERICQQLRDLGQAPPWIHLSSTTPVAYGRREAWQRMVRPGHAIYGYVSAVTGNHAPSRLLDVKPALTWKAAVLAVKDIPAGALVGYGGMFRAPHAMRIAVLAAGYADGIPHRLSNRGKVIAGGKLVPMLGAVSMDLTTIDATSCPDMKVGDAVTLLGTQGNVTIDAQQIARVAGTISYSVLTGIHARVKRIYV